MTLAHFQSQTTPSWLHAKFKKIGLKVLKLRSADGQMDGRTDNQNIKIFGGYNIKPTTFCVAGYKKITSASSKDSDLPTDSCSMIRVFPVHSEDSQASSYG